MKFKNSTYAFISAGISIAIGFIAQSIQFARANTEEELQQMAESFGIFEYALIIAIILAIIGIVLRIKKQ